MYTNTPTGKHPTGGDGGSGRPSGNFQEGRTNRFCCCLRRGNTCPVANDFDDYDYGLDYDDDDIEYDLDGRAGPVKGDGIDTRIVNNVRRIILSFYILSIRYKKHKIFFIIQPPNGGLGGGGFGGSCPAGRRQCCYGRRSVARGWGNQCEFIRPGRGSGGGGGGGGGGVGGGAFGWEQGCRGRVPNSRGKQCGTRNFR